MSFTCPDCNKTSHNPNDEINRYCGACHKWFPADEDLELPEAAEPPKFEARQIVIAHQGLWDRIVNWALQYGWALQQIPNGMDENGIPVMNNPDDLPTYAFMPYDGAREIMPQRGSMSDR